jgi:hypothetical protein
MDTKNILIVDDSPLTCKQLKDFLQEEFNCYSFELFTTTIEAEKIMAVENQRYFAAIIDLEFTNQPSPIGYDGKYAGIRLMSKIGEHSPETLIIPFSAHSYSDDEIDLEFKRTLDTDFANRLKDTFVCKKSSHNSYSKINEIIKDRERFDLHVISKVHNLTEEQMQLLAWHCALRALPFLGADGNFNLWEKEKRQDYLYSLFYVLDIAANKNNETWKTAFGNAINASKNIQAKANIIDIIVEMADLAVKLSSLPFKNYADELAAKISYACHIIGNNNELHSAVLKDIDIVKQGGGKISTGFYGSDWTNFMLALENEDCGYWKRLIQQFFHDGCVKDKEALKRRLNIPKEIRDKGAARVGEYLEEQEKTILPPSIVIPQKENKKIKGFISYSHDEDDYLFVEPLIKGLRKKIKRIQGFDSIWVDKEIQVGENWFDRIQEAMKDSDFCILLLSDSFFDSEFIQKHELPTLLAKQDAGTCQLIAVIVTECFFDNHPELNKFQFYTPNWVDYGLEYKKEIMPFSKLFNNENKVILNKAITYYNNLVGKIKTKFASRLE